MVRRARAEHTVRVDEQGLELRIAPKWWLGEKRGLVTWDNVQMITTGKAGFKTAGTGPKHICLDLYLFEDDQYLPGFRCGRCPRRRSRG